MRWCRRRTAEALLLQLVALVVLGVALAAPSVKVPLPAAPAGRDALRAQLQQLRSELSQAPPDVSDPAPVPQDAVAVPASTAAVFAGEVSHRDDNQQNIEEQLQASKASAKWLADELKNKTEAVEKVTAELSEAGRLEMSAESKAKASVAEAEHRGAQLKLLRSHERWLGGVARKMLEADKQLQTRTDTLQHLIGGLKSKHAALAAEHSKHESAAASASKEAADAANTKDDVSAQLEKLQSEKEVLQSFYEDQETAWKNKMAKAEKEAAANASAVRSDVEALHSQIVTEQQQGDILREKDEASEGRQHIAEEKLASSKALFSRTEAQLSALREQLHKEEDLHELLQREKSALTREDKEASRAADRAEETLKQQESKKCTSMQKRVAEAEGKKAQMHRALDDTVRLGKQLATENEALRSALAQAKERLASMMQRDGEASRGMNAQIQQMHSQLEELEDESALSQQDEAEDDTPKSQTAPASRGRHHGRGRVSAVSSSVVVSSTAGAATSDSAWEDEGLETDE